MAWGGLRLDLYTRQYVRVEIELVVVRVRMRAGDVLHHIHRVVIEIDVVFAVGIGADLYRTDQLVARVVRDGHVALGFHDHLVGAGVVDGDLALTLEVISLLGDVVVGLSASLEQPHSRMDAASARARRIFFMMLSFLFWATKNHGAGASWFDSLFGNDFKQLRRIGIFLVGFIHDTIPACSFSVGFRTLAS